MAKSKRIRAAYDARLIAEDMALRGWNNRGLARAAGVSPQTVMRFLNGSAQTPKTAALIANAFGYGIARYFSRVEASR